MIDVAPRRGAARALRVGVVALLAAASLACSWSVPADPGLNAKRRSRTSPSTDSPAPAAGPTAGPARPAPRVDDDSATGAIYYAKCSQCHEPFSPRHASPGQWPAIVRKYGPRAGLFGEERDRVTAWLQARAR